MSARGRSSTRRSAGENRQSRKPGRGLRPSDSADPRTQNARSSVESLLALGKRFSVLYADPPWRYRHCRSKSRAVENHYDTMTLEGICALPVQEVTTKNAMLFLWATAPKLREAFEVMEAWGFECVSGLVWDKLRIGIGYWARGQHEHVLICRRGKVPPPPPNARPASVIRELRRQHSRKLEQVRKFIEAMCPRARKLELFARGPKPPGWETWGDEAGEDVFSQKQANDASKQGRRVRGKSAKPSDPKAKRIDRHGTRSRLSHADASRRRIRRGSQDAATGARPEAKDKRTDKMTRGGKGRGVAGIVQERRSRHAPGRARVK